MKEKRLILLLSQSLIGTGCFFLYVHHIRSIFEIRNSKVAHDQLDRESLMRREDALYYSFYKTLTEESDFWTGYNKLKNVTDIEYPDSVNVLQKFHVWPELTIAYLYHTWRSISKEAYLPFLSCWRTSDMRCDPQAQAMQFYLEMVWLLGGLTILVIYSYGTLLSDNVFGGIYAVVCYAMFHSCYVSKIYERPVARENFAFPFILLQMFYVSLFMDRAGRSKVYCERLYFVITQTLLVTIALISWQFSTVIFASQLLIMMTPWSLHSNISTAFGKLTTDYAITQLVGTALAYYLTLGNKKFAFSWQLGPAVGLLCISLTRNIKQRNNQNRSEMQSVKAVALGMLVATSTQGAVTDLLDKLGVTRNLDNTYALYRDLLLHWGLQAKINFSTSLVACNPAFERMVWADLWELVKTMVVKPYCLYGVVMLAKFFRKWRKSGELKSANEEYRERMKNYVLEDFLEEHHISMSDMTNKETEAELNECLKLLAECDFDYDKYKERKSKRTKDKQAEHLEFMNDIKNLKEKINAINKKKKMEQEQEQELEQEHGNEKNSSSKKDKNDKKINDDDDVYKNDIDTKINNDEEQKEEVKKPQEDTTNKTTTKPSKRTSQGNNNQTNNNTKNTSNSTSTSTSENTNSTNSNGHHTIKIDGDEFTFHYVYSFIQMVVFTLVGLCIKKLFFLSFTLGCIFAPTIFSKLCFRNQRDIFWTISLSVFLTSIVNPGFMNIKEEYYPSKSSLGNDDLDTMLHWIKLNTEKDAVFAGPIDIIGTVYLTTRRPIVNHAHLEMRQMSERTEYVYSIFSRQQSSDIYNQCSQLKIQYLIISLKDCKNEVRNECDILALWDDMQPSYRKYPQFCAELINRNIPSFLKVFTNDNYSIIKMFSQSVQINLKRSKMPEKAI